MYVIVAALSGELLFAPYLRRSTIVNDCVKHDEHKTNMPTNRPKKMSENPHRKTITIEHLTLTCRTR